MLPPHLEYFRKANQLIIDAMSSPNPTQPEEEYGNPEVPEVEVEKEPETDV